MRIEVAGTYCRYKDKVLLVKRHPEKPQGGTWGLPGGKLEEKEDPKAAAIRETWEEVGLKIENPEKIGALYIRYNHVDYAMHFFLQEYSEPPSIVLSETEHTEANWFSKDELFSLPLIGGGMDALDFCERFFLKKKDLSVQK